MAFRTRAIQPKSINSFSTGVTVAAAVLVLAAGGCAGGQDGVPITGAREIRPKQSPIAVIPAGTATATFTVLSGNVPVAGQVVTFSIVDGVSARGATLSATSARTDVAGVATVEVRAGQETVFKIRADSAGARPQEVVVVVEAGQLGNVVVVPFYAPLDEPPPTAVSLEITMFTDTTCAALAAEGPRGPIRGPVPINVVGDSATIDLVSVSETSAVVGQALDSTRSAVAVGCLDLPGSSLRADGVVHVALPLYEAIPDPIGRFAVTSELVFATQPAGADAMAAPWRDLADCPLDPAELWIDCTIDALSPATDDDPLDCKVAPGGEGPIGDALAARRGTPILDGDGNPTGCRGPTVGPNGPVSAEAIVLGLFGSPLPKAVVALRGIAQDAASLLDRMTLRSTFDVRAGAGSAAGATSYSISHTLGSAAFGAPGATVEIELGPLALPVLAAPAAAVIRDGRLVIERHGFTLRLGASSRTAFGALALERRGLPGDAAGLVAALEDLARSADGKTRCAAIDTVLCAAIAQQPGCLAAACRAGLDALTERLDASFDVLEGTALDLYLEGSAPLLDTSDDPGADRIGDLGTPADAGIWSVDLRTTQGRSKLAATFGARRTP